MSDTTPTPNEGSAPANPVQGVLPTAADITKALEALEALGKNMSQIVRTKELDGQAQDLQQFLNDFLSRNADQAIQAMHFAYVVGPRVAADIATVLSSHPSTYIPMCQRLNFIGQKRREAAAKKMEGVDGSKLGNPEAE